MFTKEEELAFDTVDMSVALENDARALTNFGGFIPEIWKWENELRRVRIQIFVDGKMADIFQVSLSLPLFN